MKKYPITSMLMLALSFVFTTAIGQTFTVGGFIDTECGIPVEGITVTAINGAGDIETTATDAAGGYVFELAEADDYTIFPYSNDGTVNGVSTFDLVKIYKHMEGSDLLDSPYQIIAADADNNGEVNALDWFDLRSAILLVIYNFPNNTSWRFVDADYVFPNPLDPFVEQFPETRTISNLSADVDDADFIAVKIGDVNCSAVGFTNPGTQFFSLVQGTVYRDDDGDCSLGAGEQSMEGWYVYAESPTFTRVAVTQADGTYQFLLPDGNYDFTITAPNPLWEMCTTAYDDVELTFPSTTNYDFGAEAAADCEWMTVDITTPFLRRCFPGVYYVQYCNQGTQDATDAEIVIEFDQYFENFSSSLPWTNVTDNTYTFDIGNVPAGTCGSFTVAFDISCDAELGQAHCTSARIYPDTTCLPPDPAWSGADLEVRGECDGDDVIFTLTNHGEDMTEPVGFVVIEDVMIQLPPSTSDVLLNGESQVIPTPPVTANGSTWRIMVEEAAGHPYDELNTVAVEGCGTNVSGGFSLGFVTQFDLGDEEHYLDVDCQENVGSWDPNDKQGFPIGVSEEHFIERGQDIEYLIRFQNTGTDTAFTVAILDTLDADLEWASLRLGASSHPYSFNMHSEGVMVFAFEDIELPDSNVNEAASHGFVKFTISQKPNLDLGSKIENQAAIYFDSNAPVITNWTLHTIGEDYLEVTSTVTFVPEVSLNVFPNPFETEATFQLEGSEWQAGTLLLFDQTGRQVHVQEFAGSEFRFNGRHLPSGLYFFKIQAEGVDVAAGKILK